MEMTLRWYGSKFDTVTLKQIRQIPGVKGVLTTLYDTAPGEVWSRARIRALKDEVEAAGLRIAGIESVNIHDAIKTGAPEREEYIANYIETLENLGKEDIHMVCYNFMPVFDWLRSELEHQNEDGSNSLAYVDEQVLAMNPLTSELSLPGWDESYTKPELKALLERYADLGEEKLWANVEKFLTKVIPVCEKCDVNMAIHPDDPPWGIFGLPRIMTCVENYRRFLGLVDSKRNGLTFCTGSLGASVDNDLIAMAEEFADRIHFVHLRNIQVDENRCFAETAHPTVCGSLDMYGIVKALVDKGFDGYVRPDHGRMIWGETGRYGYGLYDRALGAAYLVGLFEAAERNKK